MNERIAELVAQSGNGQMRDGKLYPHIGSRTPEDWQKFAELIVRECMKAADEGMAQVTMKVEWPSYHIKKHFGVEE